MRCVPIFYYFFIKAFSSSLKSQSPKSRFRKGEPFLGLSLRVPLKAGKGACLHAEVSACDRWVKRTLRHAGVAISLNKAGLLHFALNTMRCRASFAMTIS